MKTSRDTFTCLDRRMPGRFIFSARFLPAGILGQFLNAGSALFHDSGLRGLHAAAGRVLVLPAMALPVGALSVPRLRAYPPAYWHYIRHQGQRLFMTTVQHAQTAAPARLNAENTRPQNSAYHRSP